MDIHAKTGQVIFYVDIGSAHADFISEVNQGRNLTVILDHHDPKPCSDPKVFDLNLEHYGFKGETDFSGATCCYLFARTLNVHNIDLAPLAIVGSCEIPGGFQSLNAVVLDEALKNDVLRSKGKSFEIAKFQIRVDKLFSMLQVLGAVGYYEGGPILGVMTCLEGGIGEVKARVEALEEKRKEVNKRVLARLYREGLKETKHIQWFDAADTYRGMGTKVIGQFCSFLSYQRRLVKPYKYLFGFVNVPPEIPGWGKLKERLAKASVRVPKPFKNLIETGRALGAVDLVLSASEEFGMADGHQFAANVVLPMEKKEALIEVAENVCTCFIKS
jgi:single-stranded DNA-specific DHH superfamily exonuclease